MAKISINTNVAAQSATRLLNKTTDDVASVYQRLSSGQRINRAADDAAGLAVLSGLDFSSRVSSQAVRNVNDGISFLSIASGAVEALTGITTRLQELATQAANETFSASQRGAIDDEAQALAKEYARITQSTKFNGVSIFGGSQSGLQLQAGVGDLAAILGTIGGAVGTGTYTAGTSYNHGSAISRVLSQDVNGDGYADVVSIGLSSMSIHLGDGNGSFTLVSSTAMSAYAVVNEVQFADINGDGISDVIVGGRIGTSGIIQTFTGSGNGTFSAGVSINVGTITANIFSFDTGDIDGDGDIDIASFSASQISVYSGSGTGTFSLTQTLSTTIALPDPASLSGIQAITLIDTDNNGTLDISYYANYDPDWEVFQDDKLALVTLTNTNGSYSTASPVISPFAIGDFGPPNVLAHTQGDLNGDGIADIAIRYDSGFSSETAILLGNGSGGYTIVTTTLASSTSSVTQLAIADINGDGNNDLIQDDGEYFLGKGDGTFESSRSFSTVTNAQGIAINDVNNDGVYDVISGGTSSRFRADIQSTRAGRGAHISFSLSTVDQARQAISLFTTSLNNLTKQQGVIGAFESRLNSAVATLQGQKEQYVAAASRIRDTDIASDSAHLVRLQILQQSGAAVLAQANQQPAIANQLLGNLN